jgi:hypothetical protein
LFGAGVPSARRGVNLRGGVVTPALGAQPPVAPAAVPALAAAPTHALGGACAGAAAAPGLGAGAWPVETEPDAHYWRWGRRVTSPATTRRPLCDPPVGVACPQSAPGHCGAASHSSPVASSSTAPSPRRAASVRGRPLPPAAVVWRLVVWLVCLGACFDSVAAQSYYYSGSGSFGLGSTWPYVNGLSISVSL